MKRENFKHLALAGTVTFPNTFPHLAELSIRTVNDETGALRHASERLQLLVATERPSQQVTLVRSLPIADVRAIFIPHDSTHVSYEHGVWYFGDEVLFGLRMLLKQCSLVRGIAYVAEASPALLEVHAGMTAAECAQYYPPLPCDRSRNHYDPGASLGLQDLDAMQSMPLTRMACEAQAKMTREPSMRMACSADSRSTESDEFANGSIRDPFLHAHPTLSVQHRTCDSFRPAPFKDKEGTQ